MMGFEEASSFRKTARRTSIAPRAKSQRSLAGTRRRPVTRQRQEAAQFWPAEQSKESAGVPVAGPPEEPEKEAGSIPEILFEDDQPPRITESGAGTKFALGQEAAKSQLGTTARQQLPEAYGTGRLILLPRDPHSLYAHWDLTLPQQRALNRKSADRHLIVRIHPAEVREKTEVETHVHPESRHWFIQAPQPNATYVAELGYYDLKKKWTPVAVSSPATTPAEKVASDSRVEFVQVLALPRDTHTPPRAEWPRTSSLPAYTPTRGDFAERPSVTANQMEFGAASAEPGQASGSEASRSASGETSSAIEGTLPPQVGWIPVLEVETAPGSDAPQSVGGAESEGWNEQKDLELGAVMEQMRSSFVSSMEFAAVSSGSFAPGISSPAGVPEQREFWFQVNAELIVYGGTEPGAQVLMDGRPIALREDGTFACRFALPDGEYAADFTARSIQGEERSSRLRFRRQTESEGGVGEASGSGAAPLPDIAG